MSIRAMPIVNEPSDVLDPRHYAAFRRPLPLAETLPPWCYTSESFYARERDSIFLKHWICIGHHSRVPNPGSYVAFDYMEIPVVVVRGADLKIRAFVNSCRHRGSEVVAKGSGECKFLKCPYHSWTYSLSGELAGTPMFEESDVFKKRDHALRPIRLELWAGCMWMNFDAESPDLHTYLGDLPQRTAAWRADEMICLARTSYPIRANWKLHFENFNDAGHVPFVHKATLGWKTVARRELHDASVYLGNYVMHYAFFEGSRGVPPGEKTFPELDLPQDKRIGTFFPFVYPTTGMGFSVDSIFVSEIHPDGPESSTYVRSFLVPRSFTQLPDFEDLANNYLKCLDILAREDIAVLENQQRATHSPLYKTGRFTPHDVLVQGCGNWVLDRVIGNAGP
jgi:phenylpropionate dioxygenase-like ring-hydroxylating dioxygenase large terminal subunit